MSEASATRKAAFWVGIVFLLGASLGIVLGYVFAHHTSAATVMPLTDAQRKNQKVQRLTNELSLSPDQVKQMDVIFTDVQAKYKAIHESTEPQIEGERQKGRERIRAVLTPDQKAKFEEFLKRIDEERKKNAMN